MSWKVRDDLRECLQSLTDAPEVLSGEWEVIVVDNASGDGTVEMVRQSFPNVHLIVNSENLGFTRANNQGIRMSQGKYVLLLNPDTVVASDALRQIILFLERHPSVGVLGPRLVDAEGSHQWSARSFPDLAVGLFRNTILGRFFPQAPYVRRYLRQDLPMDRPSDVDWVSGAALFIRRSLLNHVGLLDEDYWAYCEDVDLCWRVKERGYRVVYYPKAVFIHKVGRSSDQRLAFSIIQHHRSMLLFFKKHYRRRYPSIVRPIIFLGIGARLIGALAKLFFHRIRLRFHLKGILESQRPSSSFWMPKDLADPPLGYRLGDGKEDRSDQIRKTPATEDADES